MVQPLPVAVAILAVVVVVRVGVPGAVAGAAGAAALIEAVSPGGVVVVLSSASFLPCFSLFKTTFYCFEGIAGRLSVGRDRIRSNPEKNDHGSARCGRAAILQRWRALRAGRLWM